MKNYVIKRYEPADKPIWNAFIGQAKNATFLFHRDFMDYHSDRFEDYSLLFFDGPGLVAVLPANRVGNVLYSHQGLTYGGMVFPARMNASAAFAIFEALLDFLRKAAFTEVILKPILDFYPEQPSNELACFMALKNARLIRTDLNLAIDFKASDLLSASKKKHFRRVAAMGLEIRESSVFDPFWDQVLVPKLKEKYGTAPVHSKAEIKALAQQFPQNIVQYDACYEGEILAGITLFKFKNGIKSQYGATTAAGEKLRALDFLFISLIEKYKYGMAFFDMGTVMQSDGQINAGLLKQKEELGCSLYGQDFYAIKL